MYKIKWTRWDIALGFSLILTMNVYIWIMSKCKRQNGLNATRLPLSQWCCMDFHKYREQIHWLLEWSLLNSKTYRLFVGFFIIIIIIITIFRFESLNWLHSTHCSQSLFPRCITRHLKRYTLYINLEKNEHYISQCNVTLYFGYW